MSFTGSCSNYIHKLYSFTGALSKESKKNDLNCSNGNNWRRICEISWRLSMGLRKRWKISHGEVISSATVSLGNKLGLDVMNIKTEQEVEVR